MREILFRGLAAHDEHTTKKGEWVEGCLVCKYDSDAGSYSRFEIVEKSEYSIALEYDSDFRDINPILVVEETVGQYTGLKDKNGKKIFEGDIVKAIHQIASSAVGVVIFENGTFKLKVFAHVAGESFSLVARIGSERDNPTAFAIENNFIFRCYTLEVIGNVHDNPELLKGGDIR